MIFRISGGYLKKVTESRPLVLPKFDEKLWLAVIKTATVAQDGTFPGFPHTHNEVGGSTPKSR